MKNGLVAGVLAAAGAVCLALSSPSALAGTVSPADADGAGSPTSATLDILPTGLFGLDEVDVSTLGVSLADLLGVGPTTSTGDPGGTLIVAPLGSTDCPNAQYHSIQQAVDAAPPGAMIKVCAGTYVEQVDIPAGKDGLTLWSVPDLQAVIEAPPVMTPPKAIVRVNGAHDVTLRHFTITGPGGGPCDSIEYGVRVDGGGSALIMDNHITEIHDTPFGGCQNGVGVLVGRNFEGTTGTATVVHNLIDRYQKGGVVVDGLLASSTASSQAEVAYNQIQGVGPTAVIAQNGIQVSRGAVAAVHQNTVTGNVYAPGTVTSVGILLYQDSSPKTVIGHNDVYLNDEGIGLYTTTATTVDHNSAHDNHGGDGIFADTDTGGNTISYNRSTDNTPFDCADDSPGPDNAWVKDLGYTENRPGLCKHASP